MKIQHKALLCSYAEMHESHRHYADILALSQVAYLTATSAGLIAEINVTAAEMLGVDHSESLGKQFVQLVVANDRERWRCFVVDIMQHKQKKHIELMLQHADDAAFSVQLNCLPLTSAQQTPMLAITVTDLT